MNYKLNMILGIILFCTLNINAGTTGKIYGRITNIDTGEPVPGISVNIIGTNLGAASNYEGDYFIINVPPGKYKLEASGIGYQKLRKEGIWINTDKNVKVDFKLEYSENYELTEKSEQFFLQKFDAKERAELSLLKARNKLEFQRELLRRYFKPSADTKDESALLFEQILQLTKEIEVLGKEYNNTDSMKEREKIKNEMIEKLGQRFSLQEQKMEQEIKKLTQGIENLKKELQKFRTDREMIIQKQFEGMVK
jgi:hypothetical protein